MKLARCVNPKYPYADTVRIPHAPAGRPVPPWPTARTALHPLSHPGLVPIIDIVRGTNGVQFALAGSAPASPFTLNLSKGESVVFRNRDPQAQHQITNVGVQPVKPDFWFAYPLAPFAEGQPADVSSEIYFGSAATVKFACALHPSETGTIEVK
jgi:hypothetical protein